MRCINCKTPARDHETCPKCGDRLKPHTRNGGGASQLNPAVTDPRQQTHGEYHMSETYAEELLTAALQYAEAGIAVFPLRLFVRGDGKKGVSPIASWKEASTTDPAKIREWYEELGAWRGEALAIDTGKSGLLVIDQDVDDEKNGIDAWAAIGRESMLQVRTPSGGRHDYYRADPEHPITVHNRGEVGDGIDVRGLGGFVIAPPTRDPRGGSWEWMA